MRTDKELVLLLQKKLPNYYNNNGLCNCLWHMNVNEIISDRERARLHDIIYINAIVPSFWRRLFSIERRNFREYRPYFWPKENLKRRIKYVEYLVKKYCK